MYYWDNTHGFLEGPTKYNGNFMDQYILQANGIVVPWQMMKSIPSEQLRKNVLQEKIMKYVSCIKEKFSDSICMLAQEQQKTPQKWIP